MRLNLVFFVALLSFIVIDAAEYLHRMGRDRSAEVDALKAFRVERPIEKSIHFFWSGSQIPSTKHMIEWATFTNSRDFKFKLWVDSSSTWQFQSGGPSTAFEALESNGVKIHNVDPHTHIHPKLRTAYEHAIKFRNFPAASDILRYSRLYAEGGIYIDTDIAPGNVLKSLNDLVKWRYSIPRFAPQIRDQHSIVRLWNTITNQEDYIDGKAPKGDKLLLAVAEFSAFTGNLNNNYIAVHSESPFMAKLIDAISLQLESIVPRDSAHFGDQANNFPRIHCSHEFTMYEKDVGCSSMLYAMMAVKDLTAGVTGPTIVHRVIMEVFKEKFGHDAPKYLGTLLVQELPPLKWVTDDSDVHEGNGYGKKDNIVISSLEENRKDNGRRVRTMSKSRKYEARARHHHGNRHKRALMPKIVA